MTIRKRLFWSNILMIVVPMVMTAIVGVLCICMVWLVIRQGFGIGIEDSGDFYWAGKAAAEAVSLALDARAEEGGQQLDRLAAILDADSMRLVVVEDGRVVYTYGESHPSQTRPGSGICAPSTQRPPISTGWYRSCSCTQSWIWRASPSHVSRFAWTAFWRT